MYSDFSLPSSEKPTILVPSKIKSFLLYFASSLKTSFPSAFNNSNSALSISSCLAEASFTTSFAFSSSSINLLYESSVYRILLTLLNLEIFFINAFLFAPFGTKFSIALLKLFVISSISFCVEL